MSRDKEINPGGVIGSGTGLINPNSEDFRILREKITEQFAQISPQEKIENQILGVKFRMIAYLQEKKPEKLIPSGAFLKEMVEIIGVSHKDFAEYVGYKNTNISALYRGKRKISYDLAIKLGKIFKIDPALWLNLQNKVELLSIQLEDEDEYQDYRLSDLLKKAS